MAEPVRADGPRARPRPRQLDDIARLVRDLERSDEGKALLPEDWAAIWEPISGSAEATSEMTEGRPQAGPRGLKDFQRDTVDTSSTSSTASQTKRFLVADEVGLGKTLVARGVIAKAIEHLQREGIERIDVVYVCSNADIARQNINRLNVTGRRSSTSRRG